MALKITQPVIISFGLLGLPSARTKLKSRLEEGLGSIEHPESHVLHAVLSRLGLAPRHLLPTGFLADADY